MAGLKLLIFFAIFTVCAFPELSAAAEYVRGPLPNVLLKKSGFKLKHVVRRLESSPGPCMICCRQQRNVDRLCVEVEEDQADLDRVCAQLEGALAELERRRAALARVSRQIASLRRAVLIRRARIADIDASLAVGGVSRAAREQLRADKIRMRGEIDRFRDRLGDAQTDSRRLSIRLEDASANVSFRRTDKRDAQQIFDRAVRRRDNAQASLERCRAS